jgi:AcrR family transcriptional regulator
MTAQAEGSTGGLPVEGLPDWQLARRQRIIEAALRVLEKQDFGQIQISHVVAESRVARGTVYRYFSSKDHLYACVIQQWLTVEGRERKFPSRYTSEQRVRSWIGQVIRAIERQPQFFKALIVLQSSADANAQAVMAEIADNAVAMLARYFDLLGPGRAEDSATMLWAIINTLVIRAVYHGGEMSEVYRIADRFIDSLAPDLR